MYAWMMDDLWLVLRIEYNTGFLQTYINHNYSISSEKGVVRFGILKYVCISDVSRLSEAYGRLRRHLPT